MTPFVNDSDFQLYVGDVRECLRELPAESVHTVVTSPPYWGLRMYLEDGHPDKRHELGLEPTPDEYVAAMVDVFREVRRVMRHDATLWLNIGDSYIAGQGGRQSSVGEMPAGTLQKTNTPRERDDVDTGAWGSRDVTAKTTPARGTTDLKPKDLAGIPWMLAFALRADGWYLRSDIIWSKPNPMPESVTDRPTKAHEYVFLLTKSPRYFFDQEAVREPHGDPTRHAGHWTQRPNNGEGAGGLAVTGDYGRMGNHPAGRNVRSVWELATQPYPEAHFATFPEALPERCIKAGSSERGCCPECGAPWERQTDVEYDWYREQRDDRKFAETSGYMGKQGHARKNVTTTGWRPSCSCNRNCPVHGVDSEHGSSTTVRVRRAAAATESGVLLEGVREPRDGAESAVHTGLRDGEGLQAAADAGAPDGEPRGLRDGAPLRDGGAPGADADGGRGSASPERGPGGQQDRKPRADGEASARSSAQAEGEGDSLPALRGDDSSASPRSDACTCRTAACVVLDPFLGSGTTALVARRLGRRSVGVELNPEYAALCARRLQQLSLLAEV